MMDSNSKEGGQPQRAPAGLPQFFAIMNSYFT